MASDPSKHYIQVALDDDMFQRVDYWAKKKSMTRPEYMRECVYRQIAREALDYDIPTAEQARLNQIVEVLTSLVVSQKNLRDTIISGFDSLIGLARGDNMYLSNDDGVL